jgi:hypothetical protein
MTPTGQDAARCAIARGGGTVERAADLPVVVKDGRLLNLINPLPKKDYRMTGHPFDIFALPVHPAAEEFPMQSEAELKALGADIKANGQHHPVLVGKVDGVLMLMDGRNRREGCRIAGVMPDVKIINVEDPIKRIWSENGQRRNMTKGARAMVAACIFSRTEQGKRKTSLTIKEVEVNAGSLSQARTVIRYAPELVDDVKADRRSLVEAYRIASDRKKEQKLAEDSLRRLRDVAPDLADRVADEADKLTLIAASAILAERRRSSPQAMVVSVENGDVCRSSQGCEGGSRSQRQILTGNNQGVRREVAEIATKRKPKQAPQRAAARATAHEASTKIRQHSRHIVDSILAIGEELVQAKTKMPDDLFSRWLQTALGWSDNNARRFIEVRARFKDDDTEELGAIDLSVLHIAASLASDLPVKATEAPEPGILAAE